MVPGLLALLLPDSSLSALSRGRHAWARLGRDCTLLRPPWSHLFGRWNPRGVKCCAFLRVIPTVVPGNRCWYLVYTRLGPDHSSLLTIYQRWPVRTVFGKKDKSKYSIPVVFNKLSSRTLARTNGRYRAWSTRLLQGLACIQTFGV